MSSTALPHDIMFNKPSFIEFKNLRLLIMDAPQESNLHMYLNECKSHNVEHIVHICEPSYNKQEVENAGITLHEMHFPEGTNPSATPTIIVKWVFLMVETFDPLRDDHPCIAIHCDASKERASVMVAVALIEYGMSPTEAVNAVRKVLPGAINQAQLQYLRKYLCIRRKNNTPPCLIL